MENINTVNKEVNVIAFYFHSKGMRLALLSEDNGVQRKPHNLHRNRT
jgi:hypothetical protein